MNITYRVDSEHLRVEDTVPKLSVVGGRRADGGFTELVLGDLKGDVGAAEGTARNVQLALDDIGVPEVKTSAGESGPKE